MNKTLLISGILVMYCGATYGRIIPRNYVFHPEASGWIKFHLNPVKWEEAVLKCHSEGAILASPLNANFSRAITSVMCAAPVFTGISNVYSSTEYQSVEGVPLSNICLSWPESVEPDVNDKETNCIAVDGKGIATVVPCSRRLPFVCYRKDLRGLNRCGTVDPKYVFDNQTRSCYKGYADYLSWTDAYKRCAMDGAHLAVINSQTEAKVIYELAKELVSINPKNGTSMAVSIGFRAWGNNSTWLSIHGQSLNNTGYADWAPKEPNNKDGREFCGSVYAGDASKLEDGILNDVECDLRDRYRFICEIEHNEGTNNLNAKKNHL